MQEQEEIRRKELRERLERNNPAAVRNLQEQGLIPVDGPTLEPPIPVEDEQTRSLPWDDGVYAHAV